MSPLAVPFRVKRPSATGKRPSVLVPGKASALEKRPPLPKGVAPAHKPTLGAPPVKKSLPAPNKAAAKPTVPKASVLVPGQPAGKKPLPAKPARPAPGGALGKEKAQLEKPARRPGGAKGLPKAKPSRSVLVGHPPAGPGAGPKGAGKDLAKLKAGAKKPPAPKAPADKTGIGKLPGAARPRKLRGFLRAK